MTEDAINVDVENIERAGDGMLLTNVIMHLPCTSLLKTVVVIAAFIL
jgi:hypothetical protein